ncbi:MAG: RDD family protein [Methylophilaceae bacterium]
MIQNANLVKRLAAGVYELLSLIAVWLLCTFFFVMLVGNVDTEFKRFLLQVVLWVITGAYFVTCWVKTGQTLATQAWQLKLVTVEANLLGTQQALLRYALVSVSFLAFGAGFLWAFFDKNHLFLHDRLLKTRLIINVET